MNHIVIIREGDEDGVKVVEEGPLLYLGDLKPEFVKKNRIVFVGMYIITGKNENIIVYSLPKYFPKEKCNRDHITEVKQHIKTICYVVEKLRSEGKSFDNEVYVFDPYEQKKIKETVNRAELAEFIIEDYLQYGLYIKDVTETIQGGIGRTCWAKTVAKINPILQGDTPIYLNLMKKHHCIDETDFMSVIHANVLNQCLRLMGSLVAGEIDYVETESLGEDLSAYTTTISACGTYVFKEREINLFKALEAWCGATAYYENYAGVTCFDRVWEWVNDSVWGNVKQTSSSQPICYIGDEKYYGVGEAIPDTIRIEKTNGSLPNLYIFDAKYYTINKIYEERGNHHRILGFPANSDIMKQVAYLKMIKGEFIADKFYNMFLMPEGVEGCRETEKEFFEVSNETWFKVIGYVEPGKFNGLGLSLKNTENMENEEKVGIVFVNPNKLYGKYLNNIKASIDELQITEKYCNL